MSSNIDPYLEIQPESQNSVPRIQIDAKLLDYSEEEAQKQSEKLDVSGKPIRHNRSPSYTRNQTDVLKRALTAKTGTSPASTSPALSIISSESSSVASSYDSEAEHITNAATKHIQSKLRDSQIDAYGETVPTQPTEEDAESSSDDTDENGWSDEDSEDSDTGESDSDSAFETLELREKDIIHIEDLGSEFYGKIFRGTVWGTSVLVRQFDHLSNEEREIIEDELIVLKTLRHMNCTMFVGYSSSPFSIAYEYLDQGKLSTILHKSRLRITHDQVMSTIVGVAMGMNYLHSRPVPLLHGGLSSNTVWVGDNWGKIKVSDFGIALLFRDENPALVAPEVEDGEEFTVKADVYSYGVLLWECLTRRKPSESVEIVESSSGGKPRRFLRIPTACPNFLREMILACLESRS